MGRKRVIEESDESAYSDDAQAASEVTQEAPKTKLTLRFSGRTQEHAAPAGGPEAGAPQGRVTRGNAAAETLVANSDSHQPESEDLGGFSTPSDPFPAPPPLKSSRSKQNKKPAGSGSEYGEDEEPDAEGESDSEDAKPNTTTTKGNRKPKRADSDDDYSERDAAGEEDEDDDDDDLQSPPRTNRRGGSTVTSSGRRVASKVYEESDGSEEIIASGTKKAQRQSRDLRGFVADDDGSEDDPDAGYGERRRRGAKLAALNAAARQKSANAKAGPGRPRGRTTRNSSRTIMDVEDDDDDRDDNGFPPSAGEPGYTLRHRKADVNYAIPTWDQINAMDAAAAQAKLQRERAAANRGKRAGNPPLNMTGRQLDRYLAGKSVDSSDDEMGTPRKRAFNSGLLAGSAGASNLFAGGSSGMLPSGTPNNLGKVGDAALADTDPLLPAVPVTFDQVGGMEQHVQQLKEMVQLPLLYPEVFQRFAITPPRGVLFHGPPGTGKTLLARALAASCSSEGQKISFFMRKGADCLSKWVGEAERQLRLLFDEAKAQQPSIIFFDEIDGLAPVRSSKQEQIHASIVSTLLALMDGMDGRGQVVVIGATNRPDSVDPALRRPGRFDREFYFPLPNKDARRKIIDIHTKGWEPGLDSGFKDQLAQMTKGYGGADMRALCTEAALNAVQRTYPQIYKSVDRLLIKPEQISVSARDFVLSAKNMVPSTARSTSSVAAPLPDHLKPLLQSSLDSAKEALSKVLPDVHKVNILEEAEFVQPEGGFEHEQMLQTFEKMRVYRPRLVIHGDAGMGQNFVGPAILQQLEEFHVQSLDLGRLVSDSTRAAEAAVVEMFSEAKRHKPSIIYLPNLMLWANSVSDLVKATFKGLLDAMDPSEPVLLMAVVDGLLKDVPFDIRSWFGFVKSNRVLLEKPSAPQRREYFSETLNNIRKTPKQYPDAMPKKKRRLEVLPKAPPLPPRQPTEAELVKQMQHDATLREYLKFKLGPLIMDLKKRYKRFCRPIGENYVSPAAHNTALPALPEHVEGAAPDQRPAAPEPVEHATDATAPQINGDQRHAMDVDQPEPEQGPSEGTAPVVNGEATQNSTSEAGPPATQTVEPASAAAALVPDKIRYVDVDLDMIHSNIYRDVYLTTDAFLEDLRDIVNNSTLDPDPEQFARASSMLNMAIISIDQVADANFKEECQRMAAREKERWRAARRKAKAEAAAARAAAALNEQSQANAAGPQPQDAASSAGEHAGRVNLKRTADDGSEQDPAAKRVRIEEPPLSGDSTPRAPSLAAAAAGSGTDGSTKANHNRPLPDNSPLTNGVTHAREGPESPTPGASAPPATEEAPGPSAPQPEDMQTDQREATPEPEPEEPDPPFVLPQGPLDSLQQHLEFGTHDLNVDQLEQLRAALCDTIWRGRKNWDRTGLVAELRELADEFLEECAEMKAAAARAAELE